MIYKLITWIEIYFVFYPTTLGGCQCIGTPCSGVDRAETTLVGRRDLFQAKWMRRLEKASLELLRT